MLLKIPLRIIESKAFLIIITSFFYLVILFTRSFMGIYFFNFRLGEIVMGVSLLVFVYSIVLLNFKNEIKQQFDKKFIIFNNLIFISFFIITYYSDSQLNITYTYKASSYIWTIGFFYVGYFTAKNIKFKQSYLNFVASTLLFIYFYAIFGLPDFLVNFFLSISDKFEPHKGSDILIIFVVIFFFFNKFKLNKRLAFEIFTVFSFIYLPLILFKSRASFISFIIFLIFEFYILRKFIFQNTKRNIILFLVTIIFFIISVFLVSGSKFLEDNQESFVSEVQYGINYIATYRADPDDEVFRLFYLADDILGSKTRRIFSTDNNLNWRLQIWQDVLYDLKDNNRLFLGYGYNDIIPAMQRIDRQGLDRLNENVHNYVINLIARGGVLNFILFVIFYIFVLFKIKEKLTWAILLSFFIPVIFNSLFDVAMENSHYPLIFYFVLGIMYNSNENFRKNINLE